jgi:ribosome-associated translation inhibitor RaiA
MPLIEHLLQELPAEQRQLCFAFDRRDDGYVAVAVLTLASGSILAQTDAPQSDHRAAVDQVVNNLAAELQRHRVQLRNRNAECHQ